MILYFRSRKHTSEGFSVLPAYIKGKNESAVKDKKMIQVKMQSYCRNKFIEKSFKQH